MARKVYFGNDTKQTWIVAPQSGMVASSSGWTAETLLLNGEVAVKRSKGSHRRFEASWLGSMNDPSIENSLHTIKDFADGIYGDGPYFWCDPYATTSNMFAPAWATPFIGVDFDWSSIFEQSVDVTQESVLTSSISSLVGSNTEEYPAKTAKFSIGGTGAIVSRVQSFYIPEGYTLWLGAHGDVDANGGIFATPYDAAGVAGTDVELTPLGVDTTTRVNTSFASTSARKVDFYLAKTGATASVLHITGLIAQLLPTGTTPATGEFITGRGTTALEFATSPEIEYYSAAINNGQIGMSATLLEV